MKLLSRFQELEVSGKKLSRNLLVRVGITTLRFIRVIGNLWSRIGDKGPKVARKLRVDLAVFVCACVRAHVPVCVRAHARISVCARAHAYDGNILMTNYCIPNVSRGGFCCYKFHILLVMPELLILLKITHRGNLRMKLISKYCLCQPHQYNLSL